MIDEETADDMAKGYIDREKEDSIDFPYEEYVQDDIPDDDNLFKPSEFQLGYNVTSLFDMHSARIRNRTLQCRFFNKRKRILANILRNEIGDYLWNKSQKFAFYQNEMSFY